MVSWVVSGTHMEVVPLPVRQQVLPGDNQDFFPETASGSPRLTANHTWEKPGTYSSYLIIVTAQRKLRGLGDLVYGNLHFDISILPLLVYLCFLSKTEGFIMLHHLL